MHWTPDEDFHSFIQSMSPDVLDISYDPQVLEGQGSSPERNAGHCLLWAKTNAFLWDEAVPMKALLNMHLRFDGFLGFPGGLVKANETILEGVTREVLEEMAFKATQLDLTKDDFLCKMSIPDKKYVGQKLNLFFFTKQLTQQEFVLMEKKAMEAQHFGSEILGNIRVPLHYWRQVDGFPRFLTHTFAGTAKAQLLLAICKNKMAEKGEIMAAYNLHHH